jgi:hypothetical protein
VTLTRVSSILPLLGLVAFVACESDPAPGSGFHDKFVRQSEVGGRVFHGRVPAEGALVRIEGAPAAAGAPEPLPEEVVPPQSVVTSAGGWFRFIRASPRYDLFVHYDRHVLVREGLTARYFEPPFDGVGTPRAWTARLDPVVEAARPAHTVRFFVKGEKALSLTGDLANGLVATFSEFTSKITIVAIEHPDGGDLTGAVASGSTEIDVRADTRVPVRIALTPITESKTVTFAMKGGAGFAAAAAEVLLDFGVFDQRVPIARVPLGYTKTFAQVPAGFVVILRASAGGAELDSGHVFFGFDKPVFEIPMPDAAPTLDMPADATWIDPGALLTADLPGVLEHVLEPMDPSGTTLAIGTSSGAARLPDTSTLGIARATGWYRWRVRRYPALDFIDQLGGPFVRAGPSAASAPRTIALR